jgi:hypothetical protein
MLAAAATVAVVDPERVLWVPGRKLISIPKPADYEGWTLPGSNPLIRVGDILSFGSDPQQYKVTATHPPGKYVRVELHPLRMSARLTGLMPMELIRREVARWNCLQVHLRQVL